MRVGVEPLITLFSGREPIMALVGDSLRAELIIGVPTAAAASSTSTER